MTDVLAGLAMGWAWFAIASIAFGGRVLSFGQPVKVAQHADAALPDDKTPAPVRAVTDARSEQPLDRRDQRLADALHGRALLPPPGFEADTPGEILLELRVEDRDELTVDRDDVDLLVEARRSSVEVRGPDVGEDAVDGHDLRVQHRWLKRPDARLRVPAASRTRPHRRAARTACRRAARERGARPRRRGRLRRTDGR